MCVCVCVCAPKKKICLHFEQLAKGGGQNKKEPKNRGRRSGETLKSVINYIMSINSTVMPTQDPNPSCFNPSFQTDKLTCCVCLCLLSRPVQLSCDNMICASCCCEAIRKSYSLDCPCCYSHTLNQSTVLRPPAIVGSLLNEVMVSCVKGCNKAVKVSNYEQHLVGNCRGFYEDLDSPSKVTLRDVLSKPNTSPASLAEMKATSHLVCVF